MQTILEHLKGLQVRHELRAKHTSHWCGRWLPTVHPDLHAKKMWDLAFAFILVFVCFKEPLHIAFPALFEVPSACPTAAQ